MSQTQPEGEEFIPDEACRSCGLLLHLDTGCDRGLEVALLHQEISRLTGRVQELEGLLETANLRIQRAGDNLLHMREVAIRGQRKSEARQPTPPPGKVAESAS